MRLLFVKRSLEYPRWAGHEIASFQMMKACAGLGHTISLATVTKPTAKALDGLSLFEQFVLDDMASGPPVSPRRASAVQRKFQSYYGATSERQTALASAARTVEADAAILVGIDVLPYCPALLSCVRVWHANDDQSWRYLSLMCRNPTRPIGYLRAAALMALYERSYARFVDRAWVVTSRDRRAMRWLGGMRNVDIVKFGVDCDYFRPSDAPVDDRTAVFWGRLDFEANLQALRWFCQRVWPQLLEKFPDARFTIIGANATADVRQLTAQPGVALLEDLPDLRAAIQRNGVVVMPLVTTGGLKNKMLEAAALGKPIVCTPAATEGLSDLDVARFVIVKNAAAFAQEVINLWQDPERCRRLGEAVRFWVTARHDWTVAAREALQNLEG